MFSSCLNPLRQVHKRWRLIDLMVFVARLTMLMLSILGLYDVPLSLLSVYQTQLAKGRLNLEFINRYYKPKLAGLREKKIWVVRFRKTNVFY